MKNLFITLISSLILFAACKKTDVSPDVTANTKVPKLIQEKNGWHVLGGQTIPLTIGATPVQLMYENGHFSQTYKTMFYANPNTTVFNYARCSTKGDSLFMKQADNIEYQPFFYEEGDATDVRYGVSSRTALGIYGIGPAVQDVNTKIYEFPPHWGGYAGSPGKFANPHWFVYWDVVKGGYAAYRIGTAQLIDMAGFYQNDFAILMGASGLQIDETYCKANPTHMKCYFASTNVNYSVNGHSRNYISVYTADDQNKTMFRDSTSQYQAVGNILSCSDVNNVYFFLNKTCDKSDISRKNPKLLMLVFDKTTLKLTKKMFWGQDFDVLEDIVMIPSKNLVFIKSNLSTNGLFKLNLADYSITNVSPLLVGDNGNTIASLAITTDGNKLYATVGSLYAKYEPAVTNVIYYE